MGERTCVHEEVYWALDAAQEKGWHCLSCRANLGFRPDLDRTQTFSKVECILHDLHAAGITYISNSTEGYRLIKGVVDHCRRHDVYDQRSIALFLLDEQVVGQKHRGFWQQEAYRWLAEHEEGS